MIHKNCGGSIVIDLSSQYLIQSPTVRITSSGIFPGMIQIDSKKGGSNKYACSKCHKSFEGKDDFIEQIVESCALCGNEFSPDKINIAGSDYSHKLCTDCVSASKKTTSTTSVKDKMLYMYGQFLKNVETVTLLTLLMKKI